MSEQDTKLVVDRLYNAYLAGDVDGMLALFADDIAFRFLGQIDARGISAARRFFAYSAGLLQDLDFRIGHKVVDGDWAAVTWTETATTAAGEPWQNHGVDVIRVAEGRIVVLHENNDCRLVRQHFPRYEG